MSEIDIFVSSAGNFNIRILDHMKKVVNNAFVGNTGHFDEVVDWAGSEGLGRHESRQHQASENSFVFPIGRLQAYRTRSTSSRKSSMDRWRNCTFLHSVQRSLSLIVDVPVVLHRQVPTFTQYKRRRKFLRFCVCGERARCDAAPDAKDLEDATRS